MELFASQSLREGGLTRGDTTHQNELSHGEDQVRVFSQTVKRRVSRK